MVTLTPNREVTIELDRAGSVLVEPWFAKCRRLFEIQHPILDNVEQLASGVFILKPNNTSLATLHETTSGQTTIRRLNVFNAPSVVQEIPVQRSKTELTGVSPGANVSASGDHFLLKRVPATGTWNNSLAEIRPLPTLPTTPNYPLDPLVQLNTGLDVADQGYIVRWVMPGHGQEYVDWPFAFRFGGPLTQSGYGEFMLVIGGEGRALLYEWIGDPAAWVLVDDWRYAPAALVPGSPCTMRLIPHAGRWLEFRTHVNDKNPVAAPLLAQRRTAFYGIQTSTHAHLYEVTNRSALPPRPNGLSYPVTGPGQPEFRVRRDVGLRFQLADVTYPATGTLEDEVFTIPNVNFSDHVLAIRLFDMIQFDSLTLQPHGSTSAVAVHGITGVTLTPGVENWQLGGQTILLQGFQLAGRPNAVKVRVTLTNNTPGGPYSPWLFGYEAFKLGENNTSPNAPLVIDGTHYRQSPVTRVNISGANFDASHETASLRISDLVNRCSRLGVRGEGTIRVKSTFDPAQPNKETVLFDGYWTRAEGQLRGRAGATYPSPLWTSYELTCLGQWKRLAERDFVELEAMAFDTDPNLTSPPPPQNGTTPPWKVTDAIRYLLSMAGIADSQILVPDLPIRMYRDGPDARDTMIIYPGDGIAEFIIKLAKDYLNAFLIFDANALTDGAWRLKLMPTGNESAIHTFTDDLPAAGRITTHAGSYPSNTTWIARDSLYEWTIPPENTWVLVTGEYPKTKRYPVEHNNPKAYNKPGENTADVNHPDYTDGRFRPLYNRHDPTLTTPAAVKFVARRLFDIACRAQRFARFGCPLPIVNAAAIEPTVYTTHTHRPLMFGDVVRWRDGRKAMVTQCNVQFIKQHHMMGFLEVTLFNDPLPIS